MVLEHNILGLMLDAIQKNMRVNTDWSQPHRWKGPPPILFKLCKLLDLLEKLIRTKSQPPTTTCTAAPFAELRSTNILTLRRFLQNIRTLNCFEVLVEGLADKISNFSRMRFSDIRGQELMSINIMSNLIVIFVEKALRSILWNVFTQQPLVVGGWDFA